MNNNQPGFFTRLNLRITNDEKINFARHLAIIIKAGLPLIDGLRIMQRQATSRSMKRILDDLIASVNSGQSLGRGLERYRYLFDDFFINIISVGEVSGTLGANLLYLSDELKKGKVLRSRVRSAMIYPIILFIATVAISIFLTFFIFPKIITAFSQLNVKLPGTTKALIALLAFFEAYGVYLGIGFVVFVIAMKLLMKIDAVKLAWGWVVLYIPVFSKMVMNVSVANSSRILAILLRSGVKIVEAATIVAQTFSNLVYRRAWLAAAEELRKGESLAEFLGTHKKIFPPIFSAMVEVGETTGNLEENLAYLSEYYTDEVDNSLKDMTSLMEPILILIMGLIVGFVALSIITPIYSISQGIRQ
jgi:type IV pilus assembly protein PilC